MSSWFFPSTPPKPMTVKPALHHYEKNTQPPTSRVDLRNKPKPRKPLGVWDVWKVGAMVATKGTKTSTITVDVADDVGQRLS